ncbi:PREDICTED: protein monoglycylase TTLL8-like [Diuraphis noxia]|uniref:protein monoglycylase TTLL8-like n=1 Tax=Diuraphis noxia TaxID=143948 RepID=UPI0007637463|nr:PREDICTED: protein monoglycylase TTLL8-like [Diuraphis noxia]
MACNNHDGLKENGGGKFDNGGVFGASSSSSCNRSTNQTKKVDLVGPGSPGIVKYVTAVTSNVGVEKSSKGSNVTPSRGKLRRRDSGKNSIGTLDQAIRQRNIFTAVAKMPVEIQTTLIENGWIGKITVADNCFRRRGTNVEVISLHHNVERVKTVAKRYESGLVWMDARSGGVNWMTLHPDVVVNRFPRDANAALKLCGNTLAGQSEFNNYYPRAYPACTEGIHADSFVADYSLTACVSLLRAFVNSDHHTMCAKNGQVPLSALNFAAIKCHQYLTDGRSLSVASFPGKGADWEKFFEHYYKIVHDRRKFTVPVSVDDEEEALRYLAMSSGKLVDQLTQERPQTVMDGYENVWIVKSSVALQSGRPVMLNKIGDVLDRCARVGGANHIVQKYIETPLLRNNVKSDVHTWIVLSTLDNRLTVWLHRTCAVQPYPHEFSLHRGGTNAGHFDRLKTGGLHGMLRPTALTCSLKQLVETIRHGKKTGEKKQKKRRHQQLQQVAVNDDGEDGHGVYSAVRRSVVSAMTAATTAGSLDLRPNCLELFRGTFVLGDDTRPWLIDIVSDDPCMDAECNREGDRATPSIIIARSVARGVAKMLVDGGRGRTTRIGMFDIVHECSMPAGAVMYVPRPFAESAPTYTKYKLLAGRTNQPRGHMSTRVSHSEVYRQHHWWDDDSISTYVQMISAADVEDQPQTRSPTVGEKVAVTENDADQCSVDDVELSSELIFGSTEDRDSCDPGNTRRCLKLLKKCKTKISSVQWLCKSIIRREHNNKKRNA